MKKEGIFLLITKIFAIESVTNVYILVYLYYPN